MWVSTNHAAGFASSALTSKPVPVSTPSTTTPVVKGPCRHPLLVIGPPGGPCGSGNTIRGLPLSFDCPSCRWVAVRAGLANGGVTLISVIS